VGAAVLVGTAAGATVALAPAASAADATCFVVDTTSHRSYPALQAAADAATSGDRLSVKGTCTGSVNVLKDLTITGQVTGTKPATLDGTGSLVTAVYVNEGFTVTLNALAITNRSGGSGGAVFNNGAATLNGVAITGAGIFNNGTVTLNGLSSITGATSDSSGGALFNNGTATLNGFSSIRNNTAFLGGGILNNGPLTLNDASSILNNTASIGGGVYNNGTLTLNGVSTIRKNTASVEGGGVFNTNTVTLRAASTISNNTVDDRGGGILSGCGATVVGARPDVNVRGNVPDNVSVVPGCP
jgi:hypothetical protein